MFCGSAIAQSTMDFYKRADELSSTGCYSESIQYYEKAIEQNQDAKIYNDLGFAFFKIGEFSKAEESFLKSISLDSHSARAYNNLGTLYYACHDWDKAEVAFLKALEVNPEYSKAKLNLVSVYYRKGRFIKAYREYRKVKRECPDVVQARTEISRPQKDVDFIKAQKASFNFDNEKLNISSAKIVNDKLDAQEIVKKARERTKAIKSLSGRIVKMVINGASSLNSEIKFVYRDPNCYRLETLEPTNATLMSDGKDSWFYSPNVKSAKKLDDIHKYISDYLPLFPLRNIPGDFVLERLGDYDGCYIIEMKPSRKSKFLSKMLVKITKDNYIVKAVEIFDDNNDLVSQTKYNKFKEIDDRYIPIEIVARLQVEANYIEENLTLSRLTLDELYEDSLFEYRPR
ncbi:MAG: tetratricopeptide repeat protein [bacterium]